MRARRRPRRHPNSLRFLSIALLAIGCSSSSDDAPSVDLRFWAMGREGEVVTELVREFERENPDVRVDVQQIPWSAAHEKLVTGFVGLSTPDLAQLGNTWVSEFVALGALEPLDGWLAGSEVDASGYFPGIWETNVLDDVAYGVPWYVDTRVLFYRQDLLANAGYAAMPTTWSAWREAMAAVRRASGGKTYGIFLPVNEWTQPVIFGLQAGATLLSDDATRGAFTSAAFRRAFDFYLDLFEDDLAPPIGTNEIANLYQEFANGYFAMYITGPWNLGEFERRLPAELSDAWATAPLPGPDGPASAVSLAGGSSLVMFRGSEEKDGAWRLIEFLSRPEQQLRFYELTGDLPARREAWRDTVRMQGPRLRAFEAQLRRVVPTPKVPEWEQIATRVQHAAELAVRGRATREEALERLDDEVDRILAKRRWLLERRSPGDE